MWQQWREVASMHPRFWFNNLQRATKTSRHELLLTKAPHAIAVSGCVQRERERVPKVEG